MIRRRRERKLLDIEKHGIIFLRFIHVAGRVESAEINIVKTNISREGYWNHSTTPQRGDGFSMTPLLHVPLTRNVRFSFHGVGMCNSSELLVSRFTSRGIEICHGFTASALPEMESAFAAQSVSSDFG